MMNHQYPLLAKMRLPGYHPKKSNFLRIADIGLNAVRFERVERRSFRWVIGIVDDPKRTSVFFLRQLKMDRRLLTEIIDSLSLST